jgi:hypothetical protein
MEAMTQGMHVIAEQTRKDTTSMKAITVVTLFFLPGTFVSVGTRQDWRHSHRSTDRDVDAHEHTDRELSTKLRWYYQRQN